MTASTANIRARERRVSARDDVDYFRTPEAATRALLDREVFPGSVYECACGDGAMARVIEAAGYRVMASDIVDRGYGEAGRDFLLETQLPTGCESVITNPPFRLATRFAEHALQLGARKVALLCRVAFLEGQERAAGIFADGRLSRVWVFSRRITLWRGDLAEPEGGPKGGAIAFAWFVWERHHRGSQVGWI